MHKQCQLKRIFVTTVAWIPEEFAKVGKFIRLRDEDGWRVEKVYITRLSPDYIADRSRDYTRTRDASDV